MTVTIVKYLDHLSPYVHWGMRLSVGATYLWHGFHNFPPGGFERRFGVPLGWLLALLEFGAGAALIAGAMTRPIVTRLAALIVVVIMIGAIVLVHGPQGWDSRTGGMEFQMLLLVVGLYFLAKGNDV